MSLTVSENECPSTSTTSHRGDGLSASSASCDVERPVEYDAGKL